MSCPDCAELAERVAQLEQRVHDLGVVDRMIERRVEAANTAEAIIARAQGRRHLRTVKP
ncbi:MAG: hypothetical protein ACRD03_01780 [Acidimicrobiales bacterium]